MSINDATPQDWDRLKKEHPAIEIHDNSDSELNESYERLKKALQDNGHISKPFIDSQMQEAHDSIDNVSDGSTASYINPKDTRQREERKAPMEYMIWKPLEQVAWALKSGAVKYGIRNWRHSTIKSSTYGAAIHRHCQQEWLEGVDKDKDTGLHPLAHVIASCLIVMDAEKRECLVDDRNLVEQSPSK